MKKMMSAKRATGIRLAGLMAILSLLAGPVIAQDQITAQAEGAGAEVVVEMLDVIPSPPTLENPEYQAIAPVPVPVQDDDGLLSGGDEIVTESIAVEPLDVTENVQGDAGTAKTAPENADSRAMLAFANAKSYVRDSSIAPEQVKTLFFTAWQFELLKEARKGFTTALPEPGVSSYSRGRPRDPGIREIALGGIAYRTPDRWTIWLNGVRITPDAIPASVLDIKVGREHVDLKWFDPYTNKLFPVRLRPQERFNLDSRIFLPGAGSM